MGKASSIQARVLWLVLAAAGVLWVTVAALVWRDTRHELDELLDAHLAQAAALLVAQQLPDLDEGHGIDAPVLHRYAPRVAFQVFHEGRLALRSVNAPVQPIVAPRDMANNQFRTVRVEGDAWRVFATRGPESDVLVLVAEDMSARGSILAAVMRTTLGPLLLGLPLLALALWWSVRRGLRPLGEIGRALASRQADDFSPMRRESDPAEMQPMLAALDNLFARISTLLESERRFTADAAHELRTPLSAIRTQAQVALRENDPELRRHALEATIEGCDRAVRLAEQLLALSRLDAETAAAHGVVDLAGVTRGVLAALANAAIAKRQELRFDAADAPANVTGDAALLSVLVRNLADNAIRYATEGAEIRVAMERKDGRIVLAVDNGGAPPSAEEMKRFGERFYRALGTGASGSGLGLSIATRIAQLHHAELQFDVSPQLGGLRVQVSFPAAS
jgi:two-component system sensor histidine kinase QseC